MSKLDIEAMKRLYEFGGLLSFHVVYAEYGTLKPKI